MCGKSIPLLSFLLALSVGLSVTYGQTNHMTEEFRGGGDRFDLAYSSITFTPISGGASYECSLEGITRLPIDPTPGTDLGLPDDDWIEVGFADPVNIRIFNRSFETIFVGSNGYITFDDGDPDQTVTLEDHFEMLRISGLYCDLAPNRGGSVKAQYCANCVAVTWQSVPEYGGSAPNTFQIVMFFDGRIQLSWLQINVDHCIVGLSNGRGLPESFVETDFTDCGAGLLQASEPSPAHGSLHLETWANLSWRPGDTAILHDVYFGDSYSRVNDGTGGTHRRRQDDTSFIVGLPGYLYPDGLSPGTYYWRIDEIEDDDTRHKGSVWNFTIPTKKAQYPHPGHGADFVDPDVTLRWTPGLGATLHTLYFGDDYDQVNNATVGIPLVSAIYRPGPFELGRVYYWRVDEFDGSVTSKGDVWMFRVTRPMGGPFDIDITLPGDPVVGEPPEVTWPADGIPAFAIDNDLSTSYVNNEGGSRPVGFRFTPSNSTRIVNELTFATGSGVSGRDPISFEFWGSNVSIDGPYTLIAAGDIVDFARPVSWPRMTKNETPIVFENGVAYAHYQVIFPAVRNPLSPNTVELSEVEFIAPAGVEDATLIISVRDAKTLDPIKNAWATVEQVSPGGPHIPMMSTNSNGLCQTLKPYQGKNYRVNVGKQGYETISVMVTINCGIETCELSLTGTTHDGASNSPAEQFDTNNGDPFDLEFTKVTFTPTVDGMSYTGSLESITRLPTDPSGGMDLGLRDDNFEEVVLSNPRRVRIFNESYDKFFVGSNGYITFTQGDRDSSESLDEHFEILRISGLYTDLTASNTGSITGKQLDDRVAITWQGVPEFSHTGLNTFQIEMFYDGRIRLSWLEIGSPSNIIGLSNGQGLPQDFEETDFSAKYAIP